MVLGAYEKNVFPAWDRALVNSGLKSGLTTSLKQDFELASFNLCLTIN